MPNPRLYLAHFPSRLESLPILDREYRIGPFFRLRRSDALCSESNHLDQKMFKTEEVNKVNKYGLCRP